MNEPKQWEALDLKSGDVIRNVSDSSVYGLTIEIPKPHWATISSVSYDYRSNIIASKGDGDLIVGVNATGWGDFNKFEIVSRAD